MGKDYLGADQRKVSNDKKEDDEPIQSLDAGDIAVLKTYGVGPYDRAIKQAEQDIQDCLKRVNELAGVCACACACVRCMCVWACT